MVAQLTPKLIDLVNNLFVIGRISHLVDLDLIEFECEWELTFARYRKVHWVS